QHRVDVFGVGGEGDVQHAERVRSEGSGDRRRQTETRLPELRRHRRKRLTHSGLLSRRVGHAAERTVMPPAANSSRATDRPNTTIDATPRNVATQPAIISTSRNSAGNSGGLRAGRRGEGSGARFTAPPPSRSGRPA